MTRKPGIGSLLLAGLAAFGVYKYSKMSEEEKRNLKDKGKRFVDDNVPQNLKNMFAKNNTTQTNMHN
jgi:hypothetical protein